MHFNLSQQNKQKKAIIINIPTGSINLGNCAVQSYIPIWLIVAGVFCIIQQVHQITSYWRNRNKTGEEKKTSKLNRNITGVFRWFSLAWFICGKLDLIKRLLL